MKDGLRHIVGKTIAGVVVARSGGSPRMQVFLVFPDGSRFEFHGESFSCNAGLDDARGIARYVESGGGEIVGVYSERPRARDGSKGAAPRQANAIATRDPETLAAKMQRDLDAWVAAKDVIARAARSSMRR